MDYALRTPTGGSDVSLTRAMVLAEELAKPFESCRLAAYHDPVGFPTQGWGHLLSRNKWEDLGKYQPWTQAVADAALLQDLEKTASSVIRLLKVSATEPQLAALIDFAFNVGAGNLQASTLLRMLNRGDPLGAADQFLKWNKAAGIVLRGLTRRRHAERKLFLATEF